MRMENKKLGILMVAISFVFGFFLVNYSSNMDQQSVELGCNAAEGCGEVSRSLDISHFAFGFFGFMLALGFYLLFFNETDKKVMDRLDYERDRQVEKERFSIILRALDEYEKRVMQIVREQDGITQNTLKLRANMSKAKLSYILQELERRDLVKRIRKGKTLEVHLKI